MWLDIGKHERGAQAVRIRSDCVWCALDEKITIAEAGDSKNRRRELDAPGNWDGLNAAR